MLRGLYTSPNGPLRAQGSALTRNVAARPRPFRACAGRAADIARQFYAVVKELFSYGGVSTLLLEETIVFNHKLSAAVVEFS